MSPITRRSVLSLALVTMIVGNGAGQNDACGSAVVVGFPSTTPGSTAGATTNANLVSCGITNDVWYKFVAPYSGTGEVTTCGFLGGSASYDSIIGIWYWPVSSPCTNGPFGGLIGCNDDYCALQSYVAFPITFGGTYYIQLGGYSGQTGSFTLAVTGFPSNPANNFCSGALPITVGSTVYGENAGASTGGGDPVSGCNMARDVWYSFVAPSCGTYTATTCPSSSYDTVLAVWQGSCGALTPIVCNDDSCSGANYLASSVSFTGITGTTYSLEVGGYLGAYGQYGLLVTGGGPPTPMTLAFVNNGPGTIGYTISSGPPNGSAFTTITLNQGAFPNGWFHGIDTTIGDVLSQWAAGFPFVTPLAGLCTPTTIGPFSGLPPGLSVYGVAFGFAPGGSTIPTEITSPATGTVP